MAFDLYPKEDTPMTKKWFQSKTIWANVIMGGGVLLGWLSGSFEGNPDMIAALAGVQAVLNIILRKITKASIGK